LRHATGNGHYSWHGYIGMSELHADVARLPCLLQAGDLVSGVVTLIQPSRACVDIGGTTAHIHISQISRAKVAAVEDVLSVGDPVTALVVCKDKGSSRIDMSTKVLERNPGDMLTNRQAVYDGAEEMAARWRELQEVKVSCLELSRPFAVRQAAWDAILPGLA
jgi:small subunit ribosomal protein S1